MTVFNFRDEKDKREAIAIAQDFVREHGLDEFHKLQDDLKILLELAEELNIIPEEDLAIIKRRRAEDNKNG